MSRSSAGGSRVATKQILVVTTCSAIREFLKKLDTPDVKHGELETILGDLTDNFLIEINEEVVESGRDIYRAYQWNKLGVPRIDEYADLFVDYVDPIGVSPPDGSSS